MSSVALFVAVAELSRLIDMDGLAERLGVTERHVRRLVAERRIPFVKVGRFVRFDPTDVAVWLDTCRFAARSPSHPRGTVLDEEPARPAARGARSGSQRPGAA